MQAVHTTRESRSERDRTETDALIKAIAHEVMALYADESGVLDLECVERHLSLILDRVTNAQQGCELSGRSHSSGRIY